MGRIRASATRAVAVVAFVLATSQQTGNCLAQTRESYGIGITIAGPAADRELLKAQLDKLKKLPTGKKLLDAIDAAATDGKSVTIQYGLGEASVVPAPGSNVRDLYPRRYEMEGDGIRIVEPGAGTSAVVRLDPEYIQTRASNGDSGATCVTPETILAHELVHALHMLQGRLLSKLSHVEPNGFTTNFEERVTSGLGGLIDDDGLNENAVRRDQGLTGRATYARLCEIKATDLPRHPLLGGRGILKALDEGTSGQPATAAPTTTRPTNGPTTPEQPSPPAKSKAEKAKLIADLLNSPLGD